MDPQWIPGAQGTHRERTGNAQERTGTHRNAQERTGTHRERTGNAQERTALNPKP